MSAHTNNCPCVSEETMKLIKLGLFGAVVLFGCPAPPPPIETAVDVTIDVNGNTGDAIDDGFFGIASIVDQPITDTEDEDGDGNLDVFEDVDFDNNLDVAEDANNNGILDNGEDIDGDGNLDINEDIDGDGTLDFTNEDQNDNGVLDVDVEVDLNQDGVVDEQDHVTQSFFILITSSGEVTCEDVVASLINGEDPIFNGTLFGTVGLQFSFGPGIESVFASGQTVTTNTQNQTNATIVQPVFGVFTNGVASADSDATGENQISTIDIETLGDSLTATVSGDVENQGVVFPFSATVTALPQCQELSEQLQIQLESGNLFN
jgi:hypothetical protein